MSYVNEHILANRAEQIIKTQFPELNYFEKGKSYEIGAIRDWQGKKYQKTANGWVPLGQVGRVEAPKPTGSSLGSKNPQDTPQTEGADAPSYSNEQLGKLTAVKKLILSKDYISAHEVASSLGDDVKGEIPIELWTKMEIEKVKSQKQGLDKTLQENKKNEN